MQNPSWPTLPKLWRTAALIAITALGASACLIENGVECPNCAINPFDDGGVGESDEDVPRLFVSPPFGVGFECVALGCLDTRVFTLENRGPDAIQITDIRLSIDSSRDFSIRVLPAEEDEEQPSPAPAPEVDAGDDNTDAGAAVDDDAGIAAPPVDEPEAIVTRPPEDTEPLAFPSLEAPIRLIGNRTVRVEVAYQPTDATADEAMLNITYVRGSGDTDDKPLEVTEMPISTRILGEPALELMTPELNYGYVPVGETRVMHIEVKNVTSGNAVLALQPPELSLTSSETYRLQELVLPGAGIADVNDEGWVFINPGETKSIPVEFSPNAQNAFEGLVYIATNDGAIPQLTIPLKGTSLQAPYFEIVQPDNWLVDFGGVPVQQDFRRTIVVRNLGGEPLRITPSLPMGMDEGFVAHVPTDIPMASIEPFGQTTFDVGLNAAVGGDLAGMLTFETNDPTLPWDWIDLKGYGIAPDGGVYPAELDFGDIVQFWSTEAREVEISNNGTGELTISGIEWEVGSSDMIRLAELPPLPVKLVPGESLSVSVYINAVALGEVTGTLLFHTDAVTDPIKRATVRGNIITCDQGCPVSNGTPTCEAGYCEVSACFDGFHNTNSNYVDGCECQEDYGGDIGNACFNGMELGTFDDDDNNGVTRTGTLHDLNDVDLYHFRTDDTFWHSGYDPLVRLNNPPPGIEICVRITDGGGGCGGENQATCTRGTIKASTGWFPGSDAHDITVWVRFQQGAEPICANYSVRMQAD